MFVITDHKINEAASTALLRRGYEPIYMPPASFLQEGVSSHPDMLIFLGFGKLFCHKKYYENNRELIDRIAALSGTELTLSEEKISADYPHDVPFNACLLGKRIICNEKTVSHLILSAARACGCEIIGVPQGYTKCSITVVSESAIITADKAISEVCRAFGIDVLTVCEGHISLPPYNYGFIGGASGAHGDKVYFCGSLEGHPDGNRIKKFCDDHGKSAVSLSNGELQDVGSLFFI